MDYMYNELCSVLPPMGHNLKEKEANGKATEKEVFQKQFLYFI
jgi:hypothetical protein